MEEALILERGCTAPVAHIGRALALHDKLHPADALTRARYCGGIVLESAHPAKVRVVKEHLDALRVATRIVPAERLRELPRGVRAIQLEFREDALVAGMVGGRRVVVPRNELFGLHCYALLPEGAQGLEAAADEERRSQVENQRLIERSGLLRATERTSGGISPRASRLMENLVEQHLTALKFHLTVYSSGAVGSIRIRKDDFDFSSRGLQKRKHSLDNFLLLLDDALAYLPEAWNREPAVEFLHDLEPEGIVRFKPEEVGNFDRWMLALARLEREGAGSRTGSAEGDGEVA